MKFFVSWSMYQDKIGQSKTLEWKQEREYIIEKFSTNWEGGVVMSRW